MSDKTEVESAWLEIVETAPGQVELRREGGAVSDSEEPLLRMQFSQDARVILGDQLAEVTRVMITAGLQAVGDLYRNRSVVDLADVGEQAYTLH